MNDRIVFIQCLGFSEIQMINFYSQQPDYKAYMRNYGLEILDRFQKQFSKLTDDCILSDWNFKKNVFLLCYKNTC